MLPKFLTKVPQTYDGEKIASSTNVAGKSACLQKIETRFMFVTRYKYQLKVD
jgi:hypothetical protein